MTTEISVMYGSEKANCYGSTAIVNGLPFQCGGWSKPSESDVWRLKSVVVLKFYIIMKVSFTHLKL